MSEKRFVLAYEKGNEAIFEDRDYPYPKRMTNKEVEKKLNELYDENEQLEKGKMEALSLLGEEIDKNEQLRKEHQEMLEKYILLRLKIGEVLNDE